MFRNIRDSIAGMRALACLVGLVSFLGWVSALVYMDKRLHDTSNGHKYGPARHLAYLSDVIHRTSRTIDESALSMYAKSAAEDSRFFDSLADAREDVVTKHKYATDPDYRRRVDEEKRRAENGPAADTVLVADDSNPYDED